MYDNTLFLYLVNPIDDCFVGPNSIYSAYMITPILIALTSVNPEYVSYIAAAITAGISGFVSYSLGKKKSFKSEFVEINEANAKFRDEIKKDLYEAKATIERLTNTIDEKGKLIEEMQASISDMKRQIIAKETKISDMQMDIIKKDFQIQTLKSK